MRSEQRRAKSKAPRVNEATWVEIEAEVVVAVEITVEEKCEEGYPDCSLFT